MSSWESEHRAPQDIEPSCKVNTFHLKEELLLWWMSLSGSSDPIADHIPAIKRLAVTVPLQERRNGSV